MSHTYLVSDTRERHVHGFIETLFRRESVEHTIAQINTGDYLICRRLTGGEPVILACIERKSLKDFAASLKDGRYENRLKMMDLRDKTGCQLYFFVEGPAYPKPSWKISRIPYGSILSAMTNMMLREGIHVVQTENEEGTAQRLLDFVRGFIKTGVPYTYPTVAPHQALSGAEGVAPPRAAERACVGGVPDIVMGSIDRPDDLLVVDIWAKLPGISLPTAQNITKTLSVADCVSQQITPAALDALRTQGGRQLTKKGKKSLGTLSRLVGSPADWLGAECKVLSGVPGISPAMATQILTTGGEGGGVIGLSTLISRGTKSTAGTSINQKGRRVRLGDARAERIHRLMSYCTPRGGTDGVSQPRHAMRPNTIISDSDLDTLLDTEAA